MSLLDVTGVGLPLSALYLAWIGVVAALYLPCRWFAGLMAARRDWWRFQ
jgi:hypothetical protein